MDTELSYAVYQNTRIYNRHLTYGQFCELQWPSMRAHYDAKAVALDADPFPDTVGTEAKLKELFTRHVQNSLSALGADLSNAKNSQSRGDKMTNTYLNNYIEYACEIDTHGQSPATILKAIGVADPARWQNAAKAAIITGIHGKAWTSFHASHRDNFSNEKFQRHFSKIFKNVMAPPKSASRVSSSKPASPTPAFRESTTAVSPKVESFSYEQLLGTAVGNRPVSFKYAELLGSPVEPHELSAEANDINNRLTDKVRKEKEELRRKWREHEARRAARKEEKARRKQDMLTGHHTQYHDSEDDSDDDSRSYSPRLEASSSDMDSPELSRDASPEFQEPVGSFQFTQVQIAASAAPSPVLGAAPGSVKPPLVRREQLESIASLATPTPVRPGLRPASENPTAVQSLLNTPTLAHGYLKTFLQQHGPEFRNQKLVLLAPSNKVLQDHHAKFAAAPQAQIALMTNHLFSDPNPAAPLRSISLQGIAEIPKLVKINGSGHIITDNNRVLLTTPISLVHKDSANNIQIRILMQDGTL